MFSTIFGLLRGAPPYRFDFAEARRRCRILLIDDDPNALPLEDIKKDDYSISQERIVSYEATLEETRRGIPMGWNRFIMSEN